MKILHFLFPIAILLLAACGVINPEVTPFYTPPDPLPQGKPGEIIKTEKIETNNADVQAWRVMYHSRDLNDKDVAVTGIFAAPTADPPEGGYPLLAIAHGTEGLAQKCAPSLDPWGLPAVAGDLLSFPDKTIVPYAKAGYAIAATDYQGLGAPGDSSFLIGAMEAQNVVDSIRALRSFDGVKVNDQNFLWGASQGGHSAAFTAQLAETIAPEIKLNGIILVAPAVELQALVETVLKSDHASPVTGIAAMVAASWGQTYKLPMESVMTKEGLGKIPSLLQDCVLGAAASFALQPPSAYYFADPTTTSPWSDTMLLNTPQEMLYPAPVFVAQGADDIIITPPTTQDFVNKLCAVGNAVQFNLYKGTDHLSVVQNSITDVLAWLDTIRQNKTVPSNCPAVTQPATPAVAPSVSPTAKAVTTETPSNGVILSDGDFTPDDATIADLESRLPDFLAQNQKLFSPNQAPITERLLNYKRQYWGENRDGRRVIVVNALCLPLEGWQTRRVLVLDGGDCFFMVEYDPETKTFSNLSVNGEA